MGIKRPSYETIGEFNTVEKKLLEETGYSFNDVLIQLLGVRAALNLIEKEAFEIAPATDEVNNVTNALTLVQQTVKHACAQLSVLTGFGECE